jgi:uncharacterized protein
MRAIHAAGVLLLVCLALSTVHAQETSYPDPVGYVNDFANVIPQDFETRITALAEEVDQKAGAQLAVAVLQTTGDEDYQTYANKLFERWRIGRAGEDNGLLVLVVMDERKVWTEVGYGLEGALPDGYVGQVYRDVLKPYFGRGSFGEGLYVALMMYSQKIGEEYGVEITGTEPLERYATARNGNVSPIFWILRLIVLIFIFSLIFGAGRGRGGGLLGMFLLGSMLGRGFWSGGGSFRGGGGFGGGFGGFGGGASGGGGAGGGW